MSFIVLFRKSYRKTQIKVGTGTSTIYLPLTSGLGLSATGNISPVANTILYTGREYDREVNLYYLRARYYDPSTSRFISRDPIGVNDQINLYTYVANNPMKYVDRGGKEKQSLIKKYDVTDLILSIFDLAMIDTIDNPISFFLNTGGYKAKGFGGYNLKAYDSIILKASQNNGKVYFNGELIEPSNLGNLLAGFNMKNSPLPIWFVKSAFLAVEEANAKNEGYNSSDATKVAEADEFTDTVWYDAGISLHDEYIKGTKDEKKNLITNAIIQTTSEYNRRSSLEQELRKSLKH